MRLDEGQTCGEISRFFEHVYDESFCEQVIPLHREHCCTEPEKTAISQLEANPISSASLQSVIIPSLMVIVLWATLMMSGFLMSD
jgi:hypothetical protein